jgi:isocitrate/isopropylmalate dehydrogenase
MTKKVTAIPGEDAAPEAFRPTVALVDRLGLGIEWLTPPVGQAAIDAHGHPFPPVARDAIDASDATLFGSTSGPSALALFYLRWGKQTYANVRPARWFPGAKSPLADPRGVDLVILRENLEDLYVRVEGSVDDLSPLGLRSATARRPLVDMSPGKFALKVITERGTERVARFAFELARKRRALGSAGKVTCGTKHNMLPESDGLFKDVTSRVAAAYGDIPLESFIVDDIAHRLVSRPREFDVVLLPNLYGDILSDAAAALVGGLGLAASGCFGDDYAYFESAHGTAPDIAGKGIINPTATILSAAMMLEYLGFGDASKAVVDAVARVYAEGKVLTPDQGGSASTVQFCEAVGEAVKG